MVPTVDSDSNKDKRMGSHRCQKSNFYWFHSGQQFWSDRETSFSFFCTECVRQSEKLNHVSRSYQNCWVKLFLAKRQEILNQSASFASNHLRLVVILFQLNGTQHAGHPSMFGIPEALQPSVPALVG